MNASTLARYLVGDAAAIRAIAATRHAWLVGLVFVLGAGLAREYDHEDLLHQPWHALLPLAASLITATILFLLLRLVTWRRSGSGWPARGGYGAFLGLYWATAPLAWLYALPVERVLPVGEAVAANLWLLGIVSAWRVILMSRVVQVVWRCHGLAALHVVGCFATGIVAAVLRFTPLPLFSIMGGIELGPGEELLAGVTFVVMLASLLSAPWWLAMVAVILLLRRRPDGPWTPDPRFASGTRAVAPSAWCLAFALVAIGLLLLPFTQPEQWRRHTVERALGLGDVSGAITEMSRHARDDYPPLWDPPPRTAYGDATPPLQALVVALAADERPAWVRDVFLAKAPNLERLAGPGGVVRILGDEVLADYVAALERLPEGPRVAALHVASLTELATRRDGEPVEPSAARGALLERLRTLAGSAVEKPGP
jgi:hypothetical protein